MRLLLLVAAVVLALSACGGVSGGTAAGGGKSSPKAGSSAKPATGGSGASLDITVSGALSGHTTQLDSSQKNDCLEPGAAVTIGTYPMNLYPVINGKTYQFSFLIGKFKGPVTIQFPDKSNTILLYLADKADASNFWTATDKSTGSLVMNADVISGRADLKGLGALANNTTIDLSATWNCPPKK